MVVMRAVVLAGALAAVSAPAMAAYQTIDISGYVNGNVNINPQTYPTGTTTGNQNTGVPVDIATFNGIAGTWLSDGTPGTSLTVDLSGLGITGQSSFYALLNNYYGTPGSNEYNVTIGASNGDSITYSSIGGVDTRDYNQAVYSNTIAATTTPWFDNGIGQRFDVREFTLPISFVADTITSVKVTQVQPGDNALFSGLTFSTDAAVSFVPEPGSMTLFCSALAALGLLRRRRGT